MKYRTIFFGSSHHSLPALDALYADSQYEIVAIVSQPDKPVGRKQLLSPTSVSQWAIDHSVELLRPVSWKKDQTALERIRELQPIVGVLAIYGKILPQSVIDAFPKGIVNIHPSLLPKYRGPAPAPFIILNGEKSSGVSIMLLSQEMDAGPILAQNHLIVEETETPESYYLKAFKQGGELLSAVLPKYLSGDQSVTLSEQDQTQASYSTLLSRDTGKIDWSLSPEQIERMVRAFTPWPGTWTEVWEEHDGKIFLPDAMRERLGLTPHGREEWGGVSKKRMKIISAYLEEEFFIPDEIQIEGEIKSKFEDLNIT